MPRPKITDRLTCKHGHQWVSENIYTSSTGAKTCKTCAKEANHRQRKVAKLGERRRTYDDRLNTLLSKVDDSVVLSAREFKQMISDICKNATACLHQCN